MALTYHDKDVALKRVAIDTWRRADWNLTSASAFWQRDNLAFTATSVHTLKLSNPTATKNWQMASCNIEPHDSNFLPKSQQRHRIPRRSPRRRDGPARHQATSYPSFRTVAGLIYPCLSCYVKEPRLHCSSQKQKEELKRMRVPLTQCSRNLPKDCGRLYRYLQIHLCLLSPIRIHTFIFNNPNSQTPHPNPMLNVPNQPV